MNGHSSPSKSKSQLRPYCSLMTCIFAVLLSCVSLLDFRNKDPLTKGASGAHTGLVLVQMGICEMLQIRYVVDDWFTGEFLNKCALKRLSADTQTHLLYSFSCWSCSLCSSYSCVVFWILFSQCIYYPVGMFGDHITI